MKRLIGVSTVVLLGFAAIGVIVGCQSATETATTTTVSTTTLATTTTASSATTTSTATTLGGTTTTTASTTSTTSVAATFTIQGLALAGGGAGASSVFAAALPNADVEIKVGSAAASSVTTIATAETDANGRFSVEIDGSLIPDSARGSGGYVPQVMVLVSSEGTIVGGVIPAVAVNAGAVNSVVANSENYSKQKMVEKTISEGASPAGIDPTFIDKGFDGVALSAAERNVCGTLVKNVVTSESVYAEALFERATGETEVDVPNLLLDDKKEKYDAYREVMEPILSGAYDSGAAPSQSALDGALGSMEANVLEYLVENHGVSPQQVAFLSNIKASQLMYDMEVDPNLVPEETSISSVLRRYKGDKTRALYIAWHQAAVTLATVSSLSASASFAADFPVAYQLLLATKEATINAFGSFLNDDSIASEFWPDYLDAVYGAQFSVPTAEKPANDAAISSIEAAYTPYVSTRVLPYFLMTFLTQAERETYFGEFVPAAEAVFNNRMENVSSPYYIGGAQWAQGPAEIAKRLNLYNAALNNVVNNNSDFKAILEAKFGEDTALTILKALRVLIAPVQSW